MGAPIPSEAVALRLEKVARVYAPGCGVQDVSFSAPRGSITAFVGVNGAGKSTTLRCIMGLIRPDRGAIEIFGERAGPAQRRRVGFLPEERGISPRERARDAIAFHAELKGWDRRRALAQADQLLERIGLGDRRADKVGSLSKGNAQRVQLLCALVHEPELLLLDEPLSGLDPIGQTEIYALLREFRARGVAVLFSTHAIASAEAICDRVVMLANGRTAFEGPIDQAARHAPHGAVVTTPDEARLRLAAAALRGAAQAMGGLTADGRGVCTQWRLTAPHEASHAAMLECLAAHGVGVLAFEPIRQNLESAFWTLAADRPPIASDKAA
jgi:ABC-2 type transport system ATP-binding protein